LPRESIFLIFGELAARPSSGNSSGLLKWASIAGSLAVEFADVHYTVCEEVSSRRGHARRSGGVAPLEEVSMTADGGGRIGFAGSKTQHYSLEVRRALRISDPADYAFYARWGLLDKPDLHFPSELHARWQCLKIAVGSGNFFKLDIDSARALEDRMIERLTMSRICQAVSHISHLATDASNPKRPRHAQGYRRSGVLV
jgi:hypothetical protein